jgi:DNA-binding NtrC family response regulator
VIPDDRTPFDAWLSTLLVGDGLAMRRLRHTIVRAARSELPVLITGPTGAGKELVAEAIHRISGRPGPLVAVNVCALGESMFESSLFGHVRGAFTGAATDAAGLVAEADQGTLFLDEIGALPAREQVKLLRVLETHSYRPVGGSRDRVSRFRLVTATNEDLDEAVLDGRFRGDLRHRLGRLVLHVPPLAARREDIPLLVRHFVRMFDDGAAVTFDPEAMALLAAHEWPGNVRELRSVVAALVTLDDDHRIRRSDVAAILGGAPRDDRVVFTPGGIGAADARESLEAVLRACGYDKNAAAERLGVHRATVYRRMRALGVTLPPGVRYRDVEHGDVPQRRAELS